MKLEEQASLIRDLEAIFREADTDQDGFVNMQEFNEMVENKEVMEKLDTLGVSIQQAQGLFQLLDTGGTGTVDVNEFVDGCGWLKGGAKAVDSVMLLYENKKILMKLEELKRTLRPINPSRLL